MHRIKQAEKPKLIERLLNSLAKFILQLTVTLTFLGIVPLIVLVYVNIIKGYYITALVLCGILLSLIKANKTVQG